MRTRRPLPAAAMLLLTFAAARCGGEVSSCAFEHAGQCYRACTSDLACASTLAGDGRDVCDALAYYAGTSANCRLAASPRVCLTKAERDAVPVNPGTCYD